MSGPGRPKGWEKPDARRKSLTIRVHASERDAIIKFADKAGLSVSAFVRKLFYEKYHPLKW